MVYYKNKKANKSNVLYETQNGIQSLKNPIEQVRRYAFEAVNQLKKTPYCANRMIVTMAIFFSPMDMASTLVILHEKH